jgi:hypothetical protein
MLTQFRLFPNDGLLSDSGAHMVEPVVKAQILESVVNSVEKRDVNHIDEFGLSVDQVKNLNSERLDLLGFALTFHTGLR